MLTSQEFFVRIITLSGWSRSHHISEETMKEPPFKMLSILGSIMLIPAVFNLVLILINSFVDLDVTTKNIVRYAIVVLGIFAALGQLITVRANWKAALKPAAIIHAISALLFFAVSCLYFFRY